MIGKTTARQILAAKPSVLRSVMVPPGNVAEIVAVEHHAVEQDAEQADTQSAWRATPDHVALNVATPPVVVNDWNVSFAGSNCTGR